MGFDVTTNGLNDQTQAAAAIPAVSWAVAAGTANAILAAYTPVNVALTDGLALGIRALLANTNTVPTFNPDGLGGGTITKNGGRPLAPGDIPGANAEMILRYNLAGTRWELLNPEQNDPSWAIATGSADAIAVACVPANPVLFDGLKVEVRALLANVTTAPTLNLDGLGAKVITRSGGMALQAGDIAGVLTECLFRYNLANTRWELLNPASAMAMSGEVFKSLTAGVAGQNIATVQPWFPVAGSVAVLAGQAYEFEGFLFSTRAAGVTSHTTGLSFTGTATLTSINYLAEALVGDADALAAMNAIEIAVATNVVVKAASTSATENVIVRVRGVVVVNAAGTFIPNFTYSAIPGGVPTIQPGTFFRMTPMTNPQGTWA